MRNSKLDRVCAKRLQSNDFAQPKKISAFADPKRNHHLCSCIRTFSCIHRFQNLHNVFCIRIGKMKITLDLLSKWDACSTGKETFEQHFPKGAEYAEVIAACDEEGHEDYRQWIFKAAFQHLDASEIVGAEKNQITVAIEKGLKVLNDVKVESTDTVSKENKARLASSGNNSQLASSGNNSRLASSGNNSQLASSGNNSQLASSGNNSRLASSGYDSVIAISGLKGSFKLAKGGCAAVAYKDESNKTRFAVAYVGENIEADIFYSVNEKGEFIKVGE